MVEHEDNPIFDLLSQLLSLAIDDGIFVATVKDEADIYLHCADSITPQRHSDENQEREVGYSDIP